jgi:hypothetical protein
MCYFCDEFEKLKVMENDRYSYEYVLKINVLIYENGMDYGSSSKAINTLHNNLLPKTYYLNYCPECGKRYKE